MLVLISMFSAIGFNIITIVICWSKSYQIEIILTGLNLTITGSCKSTALNTESTYDDSEILVNCLGPIIPLNFKSCINVNFYYVKIKENTGGKDKNKKEKKKAEGKKKQLSFSLSLYLSLSLSFFRDSLKCSL